MNKTEARYEVEVLMPLRVAGDVIWYVYEGVSFKLGPDLRYTPDFVVQLSNGEIECQDIKGSMKVKGDGTQPATYKPLVEDAGRVKMIAAAEKFPFRFSSHWFDRTEKSWKKKVY
jgi:hypothetical protein